MEKAPLVSASALASGSKDLGITDAGVGCPIDAVLRLDSYNVSTSFISRESKRKWCLFDGSFEGRVVNGGSYLAHGPGRRQLSGSNISNSPGKEIDESSLHLGLSINRCRSGTFSFPLGSPNVSDTMKPKIDLELSLSTGVAESDITTITHGSSPYQNYSDAPRIAVHLLDDGSASSRWRSGPLVPPLEQANLSIPVVTTPIIEKMCSSAEFVPENSVDTTSMVDHPAKRRPTSVKTCSFEGCTRGARGVSGLCIAHGGGRRCQRAGCQKGAEGKTVFCKAHGGGRRCQHLGCTKSAEGRTDYCIGHGGGRRCNHEGCSRAARGKSGLCIRHGGGKRCKMDDCAKSAEGISGLCISHGGGRRCQHPSCTKGAQGSTIFCKAHGGGKRCTYLGCTKGAEGRTPFCKGHGGGKRCTSKGCTKSVHGGTLFCVGHGGGKRCAEPDCTKSARGRTSFCVRHGGGKRCGFEGCPKSAQGSTDFCKAHGGGRRCSWGQLASESSDQATTPCDKFPRGKSGLCTAHAAQAKEKQICIGDMANSPLQEQTPFHNSHNGSMLSSGYNYEHERPVPLQDMDEYSLPEDRVHGGSLMAMLKGNVAPATTERKGSV